MARIFQFELTPADQIRGAAVLGDFRAGQPIHTFGDNFLACWSLISRAQTLARVPMVGPDGRFLVGEPTIAQVRAASGEEIATAYAASLNTIRKLVRGYQLVQGPAPPLLNLPTIETALPAIIAASVVGIVAVAGLTWWGIDRNEQVARVQMHAAEQAAQVDQYIRDLEVRAAAGQPLPPPPPTVKAASYQEQGYTPVQMGVAIVLALAAGKGVADSMRTAPAARRANPTRRPRRRRAPRPALPAPRRRRPKPAAASKPNAKPKAVPPGIKNPKRKKPAAKPNPLAQGYSRATVSKNVSTLRREGRSAQQASAIALRMARTSWRKKHPRGAFPSHLETIAERKGHTKRKRNAAPKKRATSKRSAPKQRLRKQRKKNPTKRTPKAKTPRARRGGKRASARSPRARR